MKRPLSLHRARWVFALVLLLPTVATAVPAPDEVIRESSQRLVAALAEQHEAVKADPQRAHALVERYILPHVDFGLIARWVLGANWRRANPDQRARFTREFRELVVRTYTTAMVEYSDKVLEAADHVRVLPARVKPGSKNALVRSRIALPDGPSVPVNYRMRLRNGGWKVFDVTVDGVSLVSNYRSGFAATIRRNGMEAVIEELAVKNREAGAGPVAQEASGQP